MEHMNININTEFIKLDQFLKWCGIAETGGVAHDLILQGEVTVNNDIETRRGKKLRAGDKVYVLGRTYIVTNTGESS